MKNVVTILLVLPALALVAPVAPSFAEGDEYYVEIGSDAGSPDAKKEWEDLVAKHKKLLGGLKFYPKSVIHGGASVATRIQAGPIASKNKAQAICTRLFASQVPCFVIEGLGDTPPSSVMNLSEKAEEKSIHVGALPWVAGTSTLPWLESGNAPAAEPASEGQEKAEVMVKALPELKEAPKAPETSAMSIMPVAASKDSNAGWLTVEAFANEEVASSFWQEVRTAVPEKAAGLRVRIMKPLLAAHNQPVTLLNIGPFASRNDAYAFCHDGIQAKDKGLLCRFGSDEMAVDAMPPAAPVPHSGNGGVSNETQRRPLPGNPQLLPASVKTYWAQVLSAPSQMEALHAWEDIKTSNGDLLEGLRSTVSSSPADKNIYVVRIGPMASQADAKSLCGKLKDRNVDCLVALNTSSQ